MINFLVILFINYLRVLRYWEKILILVYIWEFFEVVWFLIYEI